MSATVQLLAQLTVLALAPSQRIGLDLLGIDCEWEVEHHFLEEHSHSSR